MPTFDDAVRSQAKNRPIILYTVTTLSEVHRFTTHAANVTYGDNLFPALTVVHDDEQLSQDTAGDELVIHLPISHPLVQRYAASGIPEQSVQVLVQELQSTASVAAQAWTGQAQSLTVNGHMAAIRVPTTTNDALKIQLPTIAAIRTCQHVLFDGGCSPNPGGFWPVGSTSLTGGPRIEAFTVQVQIVAVSADGLTITTSSSGFADGFFQYGKITSQTAFGAGFSFAPTNETRSIVTSSTGTLTLTIDQPFVVDPASMVEKLAIVVAGCDHLIGTCHTKFSNEANFSGYPDLNSSVNPWTPNGFGVVQQT